MLVVVFPSVTLVFSGSADSDLDKFSYACGQLDRTDIFTDEKSIDDDIRKVDST